MESNQTNIPQHLSANDVEEHLRSLEERLAAAWVEGDRVFIEGLLADDWTVIDLNGRILKKAEVLEEAFGSKTRKVASMRIDEIAVRSFNDWAVVTGRTFAGGEYQGEAVEVRLRFTDIFVNHNGNWQVVASQATLINY
jgi:hypothetical protein